MEKFSEKTKTAKKYIEHLFKTLVPNICSNALVKPP